METYLKHLGCQNLPPFPLTNRPKIVSPHASQTISPGRPCLLLSTTAVDDFASIAGCSMGAWGGSDLPGEEKEILGPGEEGECAGEEGSSGSSGKEKVGMTNGAAGELVLF